MQGCTHPSGLIIPPFQEVSPIIGSLSGDHSRRHRHFPLFCLLKGSEKVGSIWVPHAKPATPSLAGTGPSGMATPRLLPGWSSDRHICPRALCPGLFGAAAALCQLQSPAGGGEGCDVAQPAPGRGSAAPAAPGMVVALIGKPEPCTLAQAAAYILTFHSCFLWLLGLSTSLEGGPGQLQGSASTHGRLCGCS